MSRLNDDVVLDKKKNQMRTIVQVDKDTYAKVADHQHSRNKVFPVPCSESITYSLTIYLFCFG